MDAHAYLDRSADSDVGAHRDPLAYSDGYAHGYDDARRNPDTHRYAVSAAYTDDGWSRGYGHGYADSHAVHCTQQRCRAGGR